MEGDETCEDSNVRSGDGCDASCRIENHDDCNGPVLEMANETVTINSSTVNAVDDINTSGSVPPCAYDIRQGADMIYAVKATVQGTFTAVLNAAFNNHFLHIRRVCPGLPSDEIACDWANLASQSDTNSVAVSPGQLIYVIADGHLNDSGPFTLTLTLQ